MASKRKTGRDKVTPHQQAKCRRKEKAGRGGVIPPPEHRFVPGVSGNPGGRPKGTTLLKVVRELLNASDRAELESAASAFVDRLKAGSFQHAKELIDRDEGKVPDRVANADGSNLGDFDPSVLTLDELILLRNLQRKATVRSAQAGSGDLPAQPE